MTEQKEVALVVGASRGIGRQVAIDLARSGFAGMVNRSLCEGRRADRIVVQSLLLPKAHRTRPEPTLSHRTRTLPSQQ